MASTPSGKMLADAIVLFGATGDLSHRMVLPSLFFLDADDRLPPGLKILATARSELSRDAFVDKVKEIHDARPEEIDPAVWKRFAARLDYAACDATTAKGAGELAPHLKGCSLPMFFLAVSPSLYAKICVALAVSGLATADSRIVLEKPIGRDLESSREVNAAVGAVFSEDRIFRIDHYLGKETVQNLIALRFANSLFEPLWNNLTIDHVQITVAETEGVGDRWPYYDEYGALRDMPQNHMLQMLCFVAMETPGRHGAGQRPEREGEGAPLAAALHPHRRPERLDPRPPYTPGVVGGKEAAGYEGRSAARRPAPRPSSRCGRISTTGAGAACPSTCAPASVCPSGAPRSPSSSSRCRTRSSATRRGTT